MADDDKKFEENKKRIKQQAIETGAIVEDALRSIADKMGDIIAESMGQITTSTEKTVKSLESDLKSFATSASKIAAEIGVKASEGMLKTSDLTKALITNEQKIIRLRIKQEILSRAGKADLTEISHLIQEAVEQQEIMADTMNAQLEVSQKINSAMGLTGNAIKTASGWAKKLGISGLDEVFSNASKSATRMSQKVTLMGKKDVVTLGDKIEVMGAGLGSLAKGLTSLFTEPLFWVGLLTTAFKIMKDLVFDFSKDAVEIGRAFGIGYTNASNLNESLREAARNTGMLWEETRKAYIELNKSAGTQAQISEKTLATYNKLIHAFGLSKETAQEFYKLSVLQGRTLDETVKSEFVRVVNLKKQYGSSVDIMEVMGEMGKASAATKLSLQGQGIALGQAAFQAKVLGLDFQQLDRIAGSLLDFESSIQAEMEAELLTGKQLNLEKARMYALNNDLAGLGKELNAQGITGLSFAKMNRLQQEAIGKAMGMNRDSMAEMLMRQDLISKGKMEELGSAEEIYEQQKKMYTLQEQFNRLITKLKEIFLTELSPVIQKITDWISDESNVNSLVGGIKSAAHWVNYIAKILSKVGFDKLAIGGALMGAGALALMVNKGVTFPLWTYGGGGGGSSGSGQAQKLAFRNVKGAGISKNIKLGLRSGGAISAGVLGGLASAGLEVMENWDNPNMSTEEKWGRGGARTAGGGLGGWGGAAGGAAIGTAIFPGVGTVIGGLLGGLAGGLLGDWLGDEAGDLIYGEEEKNLATESNETLNNISNSLKSIDQAVSNPQPITLDSVEISNYQVMSNRRLGGVN